MLSIYQFLALNGETFTVSITIRCKLKIDVGNLRT